MCLTFNIMIPFICEITCVCRINSNTTAVLERKLTGFLKNFLKGAGVDNVGWSGVYAIYCFCYLCKVSKGKDIHNTWTAMNQGPEYIFYCWHTYIDKWNELRYWTWNILDNKWSYFWNWCHRIKYYLYQFHLMIDLSTTQARI